MNIEKYQQYANSKLKADKMRKEIKETLDNYQTAQRVGYEAAKRQFQPLLEVQEAQTKAQEAQAKAQIEATNKLQKSPGLTKETQEFIIDNGFMMPATLLNYGKEAFNTGKEEEWKEHILNLSIYLGNIIENTENPKIKKVAAEYRKQLKDVVSTLFKYKRKEPTSMEPSPATSTESEWFDNFNNSFTDEELNMLDDIEVTHPQQVYKEGLYAKQQSPELYKTWDEEIEKKRDKIAKENKQKNIFNKEVRTKYYKTLEEIRKSVKRMQQKGTGIRRNQKKITMGSGIFTNPQDLFKKLELITGSILAGNTSKKIRNDAYKIIDKLLSIGLITKSIDNKYIKEYLVH